MAKTAPQNLCAQLVNLSIGALIIANFLFLGQKLPLLPWIAKWRISRQLEQTGKALDAWRAEHGKYPGNLGEIMASPAAAALKPSLYDAAGNRIQYLRLGFDQYLLRSFGPDSQPAKGSGAQDDMIHSNISQRFSGGLLLKTATTEKVKHASTWSPAGAEGTWSPDERWIAKIAANPETGERRLVVIDDARSRILISEHDRVEEFYWIPGPHQAPQIIFTATGSELHSDGIWRWAIDSGLALNMMPTAEVKGKKRLPGSLETTTSIPARATRFALALMQPRSDESSFQVLAVRLDGPDGYYANTGTDGRSTRTFLDARNLYRCRWQSETCERMDDFPLEIRISPDQPWNQRGQLTAAQSAWTRLPVRGTAQDLLEKWFDATRSEKLVSLRPYVLFYTIILQDQVLSSPVLARDATVRKRLQESADAMVDSLVGSADAARYLQLIVSNSEREKLAQNRSGSRPIFEFTDASGAISTSTRKVMDNSRGTTGETRDGTTKKTKKN
jgi:hypothetical protein